MTADFVGSATKAWQCAYCDTRNVTDEADTFAEQCANCTRYNDVNWDESGDISVSEARAVADRVEAD